MKRKFVSLFLMLVIMVGCLPNVVWADNIDNVIQQRIDALYNTLGNKFFTVNQQPCGYGLSSHKCDNCKNSYIVNADWFKNLFGSCNANNFANSYVSPNNFDRIGWSCFGFANFAEWYIFKSSNSDQITTDCLGTYNMNYSNISAYAKKGDILRFGTGHSVIYIGCDANGISVLDCNWHYNNGNCRVEKNYSTFSYLPTIGYSTFTICRAKNRNSIITDTTPPIITNFNISNMSSSSFTINCSANETLSRAYIIVYNSKYPNGQAFNIYNINNNYFSTTINTADYGGTGEYAVSVYVWDTSGNEAVTKSGKFNTSGIKVTNCTVSNISNKSFTVNCITNTTVSRAYVIVYNSKYPNGQAFNIYNINKSSFNTTINVDDYGGIGEYAINVYVFDDIGNEAVGKTGHFNVPIIQSTPIPSTPSPASISFTIEKNNGYVTIKNNTNQAYNATIILAKYNDDIFEDSTIIPTTFVANEERTVHTDYGSDYKVFVWDSLSGMKPLAK